MKNTVKRILSIVLVVALMATLSITAFAADITITTAPTVMVLSPTGKTTTLVANCSVSGHTVAWESNDPTIISVSGNTATAHKIGTTTLKAKCTAEGCNAVEQQTATITVKCCTTENCNCADTCSGTGYCTCDVCKKPTSISIDKGATVSVVKGGTVALTATPTYPECCASNAKAKTDEYAWARNNDGSVNTELSAATGAGITVTGKEYGSDTVTVTIAGITQSVTVNVVPNALSDANKTVNVLKSSTKKTLSTGLTAATGTELVYKWSKTEGGHELGTAATYDADISTATTAAAPDIYYCDVSVKDKDSNQVSAAATIKFTVNVKEEFEVQVAPTTAGIESVVVGGNVRLKATVYKNAVSSSGTFTQTVVSSPLVAWSTADANTITIENVTNLMNTVTGKAPNTTGVDITATYIPTAGVSYSGKYTLKVQDNISVGFKYTSATGTVLVGYTTDDAKVQTVTNLTAGKTVYPSTSPVSGNPYTYTVAYESSNTNVATVDAYGTVRGVALGNADIKATVTVKNNTTVVAVVEKTCKIAVVSDNYDICANIKVGSTITFKDANFSDWYAKQVGSTYTMNHVVIGTPSNAYGTFKYNGVAMTPNETAFYVAGRTGTYYIANTSYTAGASAYYTTVPFTCYGGTTTASYDIAVSGTMYIFVNAGAVGNITYNVSDGYAEKLLESNFLTVYTTATGSTSPYDSIEIDLLDVPEMGDLYVDYVSAASYTAKITSSNYKAYTFVADDAVDGAGTNISKLTYVPKLRAAGDDIVRYAVYNNGTLCYVSRMIFNNGESDSIGYAEGYSFKGSDFYSATVADPVVSVKFAQPSTGKIYSSYANGRGTLAAATDSFYTYSAISGTKPITSAVYIPEAGYEGNVSVKVTATTLSGVTTEETIVLTIKSKTASSVFTDVTAKNTGTWSANAIDYAYKWGLVNGTTTTAPLKFGPGGNMTRAQFVAVLYRAAGSPSVAGITNPFTDVKNTTSTSWYYNAVLWAYTNKIVTGATATTFNPNGKLTREQLSKMLYGFDQVITGVTPTGGTTIYDYTDYAKVSSYAVDSIKWAVGKGIITSASSTAKTINPQGTATRAQVATMLHRYLTK